MLMLAVVVCVVVVVIVIAVVVVVDAGVADVDETIELATTVSYDSEEYLDLLSDHLGPAAVPEGFLISREAIARR